MSALITVDLSCDRCPQWFHGEAPVSHRRIGAVLQRVRRKARPEGWTSTRDDGRLIDLCPACTDGSEDTPSPGDIW